jgi:hypothetical protein
MRDDTNIWTQLSKTYPKQKTFWKKDERSQKPTSTDRLIHYLVDYFTDPSTARNAIRTFRGLNPQVPFCSWNEVRVSTLREIREALEQAGAKAHPWELAITIKDFLQNAWDTLFTCELSDVTSEQEKEVIAYLKQLRGAPNGWVKDYPSPFRPHYSSYNRKKHRGPSEPVLPNNAIKYVRYLLNRTKAAPFEFYSERALKRIGLIKKGDTTKEKIASYNKFIGTKGPVTKHRRLVRLGKTVCIKKPRCSICPISDECLTAAKKAKVASTT